MICAVRRRRFSTEEGHEKWNGGSNNQFSGCLHHMQQSVYNFHISFIVGSDRTSRQLMYRLPQCRSYCSPPRLGAAIRDPIFMFLCHSCCNDRLQASIAHVIINGEHGNQTAGACRDFIHLEPEVISLTLSHLGNRLCNLLCLLCDGPDQHSYAGIV